MPLTYNRYRVNAKRWRIASEGTADNVISFAKTQWISGVAFLGAPEDEDAICAAVPPDSISTGASVTDQIICADASTAGSQAAVTGAAKSVARSTIGAAAATVPRIRNSLRFRIILLFHHRVEARVPATDRPTSPQHDRKPHWTPPKTIIQVDPLGQSEKPALPVHRGFYRSGVGGPSAALQRLDRARYRVGDGAGPCETINAVTFQRGGALSLT